MPLVRRSEVSPPNWALLQLRSICQRSEVLVPHLRWYRSGADIGGYDPARPMVSVQETFERDHRPAAEITFLHEIAHHLALHVAASSRHSPTFWEICWRLYLDQGVALDQAAYGEFSYRTGAERALRLLEPVLPPAVEAAGAYGTACRHIDRLQSRIRRLQHSLDLDPASPGLQRHLKDLRSRQAILEASGRSHLRMWRSVLANAT